MLNVLDHMFVTYATDEEKHTIDMDVGAALNRTGRQPVREWTAEEHERNAQQVMSILEGL